MASFDFTNNQRAENKCTVSSQKSECTKRQKSTANVQRKTLQFTLNGKVKVGKVFSRIKNSNFRGKIPS